MAGKTVPMTFGLLSNTKMRTYGILVGTLWSMKKVEEDTLHAENIDNLRKNLLKKYDLSKVFINVYTVSNGKKHQIGVISGGSTDDGPTWATTTALKTKGNMIVGGSISYYKINANGTLGKRTETKRFDENRGH